MNKAENENIPELPILRVCGIRFIRPNKNDQYGLVNTMGISQKIGEM